MARDSSEALHPDVGTSRALAGAGAGIVALEALPALAGRPSAGLAVAALLLAPGLALAALLPAAVRRSPVALLCAVPVLGFAATSVTLITLTRIGVPLTGLTARLAVAALVVVGLVWLPLRDGVGRLRLWELMLPVSALVVGALLQERVLGGSPVPGNDWAKYLLYADEIRRQGALLIDNPYWMLGVPFREDPGVPSVYGAFLAMSDASTATLAHGIWVFALMGIAAMYAWVRALWGPLAGGLAALLYAALPINQNILGWHGLANVAALVLIPLVLLYATELVMSRRIGRREAAGFALLLVALAAAHRLSVVVTLPALALVGVVALVAAGRDRAGSRWSARSWAPRRALLRSAGLVAGFGALLGWGVAWHLWAINRTFGGTQGYEAYLNSKLDLDLLAHDLTRVFCAAAVLAVVWAALRLRRAPELGVPLAYLVVAAALAYAWVVHLPVSYLRMAYYLPVALVPPVAVALAGLSRRAPLRAVGLCVGLALTAVIAASAWDRADSVRAFYRFAEPASLRGLDLVASRIEPGEVVVTDRCWSFLATWLLGTRTLPALAPEDIQPKAELPFARRAQAILDGRPAAVAYARRIGVRHLLVDPTCVGPDGRPLPSPLLGEPIFVSRRLIVLEVPPDPRRSGADGSPGAR